MSEIIYAVALFILAGLVEIRGGYLVWLWLREGKPYWYGIAGGLILVLYGVIPTMQKFPAFGRVYEAWCFHRPCCPLGMGDHKKTPDVYDWLGAAVCLIGVGILLWAPRQ
ncbi:YnfA family protein [Bacillus sp. T33-2]|uniref:YnfA family protein n=1 Tax=Bacillus sp. T33-2 TaxID=2054168 RepID=UPI000C771475|nr:YnfA family protein [Bacillus sp. T33-2]PLR95139.1 hypothetical protein CVD19_15940 [Bacillus sp. T33-2]